MTVKELKEKLEKCQDDLEVVLIDTDSLWSTERIPVDDVEIETVNNDVLRVVII